MDAAYEAYKQKCRELGIRPSPKEKIFADEIKSSSGSHHEDITEISRKRTLERGFTPKKINNDTEEDSNIKEEEIVVETTFGKGGVKRCASCGFTKSAGEFYKNKTTKDGLESYCKDCKKSKNGTSKRKQKDESNPWPKQNIFPMSKEVVRYITIERAKEFVLEAYKKGYEDHGLEMKQLEENISLNDLLQ
ncbi:hypothetical protein [Sulfurimonas sp. HSL-1716]|uniref:hypothetical protein n=1 Tax=Hydrocurvibacter sulfurireducens TaxID=3131937 RepID=UPI0031F9C4A7